MDNPSITIRRTEPGDYEAVRQIFASPSVVAGTLQMPFPSVEGWRKRLANPPEGLISLVACADGEVIGQTGLTYITRPRRRHVGQLGMAVREDWQGKGVGSALMAAVLEIADNWLNLTRLELTVYTTNDPAVRLYQKFGFVVEGTLTQYAFCDGAYADAYTMARLKRG